MPRGNSAVAEEPTRTRGSEPGRARGAAKKKAISETPKKRESAALPTVMRVDLIPPIVEVRRKQAATVRLLMLGLVGLTAIAVAAGFAVSFLANSAEQTLKDEQARNVQLVQEEAQYSEVNTVLSQLGEYDTATLAALFAETDWDRLMTDLDDAMPANVTIATESISIKGVEQGVSTTDPEAALDALGVIQIDFTATGPGLGSTTELLNGLQDITGYASASASSLVNDDESTYTVTGSVQLDATALGGTARTDALDPDALALLHQALEVAVTMPVVPEDTTTDDAADAATEATEG